MVLHPYLVSQNEINSTWESKQWEQPTGYVQAYTLPGVWSPYESIDFLTDAYHVFFCHEEWSSIGLDDHGGIERIVIPAPFILIYARGEGETPAEIISSGRESAESLAGLLNVLLGHGYPILSKAYEAVFRKDKIETVKFYPGRIRVTMQGVTKDEIVGVLEPLAEGLFEHFPDNVKLALRWYAKGISEENPVDKFIALYECSLAIVSRWHYASYPDAYKGRDAPPRRMFGDWVKEVLIPKTNGDGNQEFGPFGRIVKTRNRIFKASDLGVSPEAVTDVVACATQTLEWALSESLPKRHINGAVDRITDLEV